MFAQLKELIPDKVYVVVIVEFLKSDNFYIEITNLLGQIIKTQKAELINQININLFEKGIYFINVMDNNQSVYRSRIIKE